MKTKDKIHLSFQEKIRVADYIESAKGKVNIIPFDHTEDSFNEKKYKIFKNIVKLKNASNPLSKLILDSSQNQDKIAEIKNELSSINRDIYQALITQSISKKKSEGAEVSTHISSYIHLLLVSIYEMPEDYLLFGQILVSEIVTNLIRLNVLPAYFIIDYDALSYIHPSFLSSVNPSIIATSIEFFESKDGVYNQLVAEILKGDSIGIENVLNNNPNFISEHEVMEMLINYDCYAGIKYIILQTDFKNIDGDFYTKWFHFAVEAIIRGNKDIGLEFSKYKIWSMFRFEEQVELVKLIIRNPEESFVNILLENLVENKRISESHFKEILKNARDAYIEKISNKLQNQQELILKSLLDSAFGKLKKISIFDANEFGGDCLLLAKISKFFDKKIFNDCMKQYSHKTDKILKGLKAVKNSNKIRSEIKENIESLVKRIEDATLSKKLATSEVEKSPYIAAENDNDHKPEGDDNAVIIDSSIEGISSKNENDIPQDNQLETVDITPPIRFGWFGFEPMIPLNIYSPASMSFNYGASSGEEGVINIVTQWLYHSETGKLVYSISYNEQQSYLIDLENESLVEPTENLLASQTYTTHFHTCSPWLKDQIKIAEFDQCGDGILELTFNHKEPVEKLLKKMIVYKVPVESDQEHSSNNNEPGNNKSEDDALQSENGTEDDNNSNSNENTQNQLNGEIEFNNNSNATLSLLRGLENPEFIVVIPEAKLSYNENITHLNDHHQQYLDFKEEVEQSLESRSKVTVAVIDHSDKVQMIEEGIKFVLGFIPNLFNAAL